MALAKIPSKTFAEPPQPSSTIKPVLRGIWFDPVALIEDTDGDENSTSTLNIGNAVQGAHDILYFVNKNDPQGPEPTNQDDPQFPLWEYPVSLWKTNIQSITNL